MSEPGETKPVSPQLDEAGSVKISDEVIAAIAGLAAAEIDGVAGMSGGLVGDISEMLGKKTFAKGVKVETTGKNVTLDLFIVVKYGVKIPELAASVQANVKKAVEYATGLSVKSVNIHVQGVSFKETRSAAERRAGEAPAEELTVPERRQEPSRVE